MQAGRDAAVQVLGLSSTFTLSMVMAALSFTFLGIFALILAKQLRTAFKTHQEAQQRITDTKRLYEETVQRGRQDPLLKKLLNKDIFEEDMKSRSDEPQNAVAYMSMDIQGFKAVNDRISHKAGDEGLHWYEDLLLQVAKEAETFGRLECKLYRTGGEDRTLMICACGVVWCEDNKSFLYQDELC